MQYLQESMGDEVDFLPEDNTKIFYKLIVLLWDCVARHAQSTQNNKFTTSLWYLKENVKDEVDLLPTDERQSFIQIAIIILGMCGQEYPNTQVYYFFVKF